MSIGIYKIENKINKKVYIGQSVYIEKRWQEHCRKNSSSLINKAIKTYGKENFDFSILEECKTAELDSKEIYYIKLFNSVTPNGYNVTSGGNSENQNFYNYSEEILYNIISDIKNTTLSFQEIADKYQLTKRTIYYLNRGDIHTLETETYPLRAVLDFSKKYNYCIDCGKEISKTATRCPECYKKLQRTCTWPSRELLKDLIRNESFTAIGQMYKVCDNTIRKWCKAYNLPFRKKDIKNYSNEEWLNI